MLETLPIYFGVTLEAFRHISESPRRALRMLVPIKHIVQLLLHRLVDTVQHLHARVRLTHNVVQRGLKNRFALLGRFKGTGYEGRCRVVTVGGW